MGSRCSSAARKPGRSGVNRTLSLPSWRSGLGDLVVQSNYFGVLVPIAHRHEAQHG